MADRPADNTLEAEARALLEREPADHAYHERQYGPQTGRRLDCRLAEAYLDALASRGSAEPTEDTQEIATIRETLFTGGYDGTEGQEGSRDTTWTDFGIVIGIAERLASREPTEDTLAETLGGFFSTTRFPPPSGS